MDEPAKPSRRKRKAAERRMQIINAAANLFAEKGFHRTTTRDIAEEADVSEGTLYNYFESKDDLLLDIMDLLDDVPSDTDHIDPSALEDAREFLISMMQGRRELVDQYHPMLQSVLSEILVNPELRRRYYNEQISPGILLISQSLQRLHENGQIREINIPITARMLTALMLGLYVLEVMDDPLIRSQWDVLSHEIAALLIDGAAPLE
ncbi:MAG: TetR/AcrR family transcriptional regulator [Anaerolineales bacterium]